MRRIKLLAAALSLCALLTACDTGAVPESTAPASSAATSAEPSPPQDVAPAAEVTTSTAGSSTAAQSTPEPAPTAEPDESAEPLTESFNEPSAETAETPAAATQTSVQTPAATTTTAATTAPPAPVVIPEVRTVSSPGTEVFTCESGSIDYSNAADGYISVTYTGGSDSAKLRMICGEQTYDHDIALGKADYFPLSCGSGSYTLQLYEHAEGKMYSLLINKTVKLNVASETEMFLLPNHYVKFDKGSAAVAKSAELCAGKSGTVEKLAAVFTWLTDNVTYDKELAKTVRSGYCPDPDRTLAAKKGICFDYASLLCAMMRAQGVPTRLAVGYAATDIYHAWNEVYTEETGWITPQLLLKSKGYNIVDATFYASAADKGKISDYISNAGNYSAIYYY